MASGIKLLNLQSKVAFGNTVLGKASCRRRQQNPLMLGPRSKETVFVLRRVTPVNEASNPVPFLPALSDFGANILDHTT